MVNSDNALQGNRLRRRDASSGTVVLRMADDADRPQIYRMRHQIYARELGQHPENPAGFLTDGLDRRNEYIVVDVGGTLAGFVSLTPPGATYSIDKYVDRTRLPFPCDDGLFEVRLLTVAPQFRNRSLASLLMFAALRWVETHGGRRVVAIGRTQVLDLYLKAGLRTLGTTVQCGAVRFELLAVSVQEVREWLASRQALLRRLVVGVDWTLPFAAAAPPACFHGGAFWGAIGDRFDNLDRRSHVINADVLDAWFPPSPGVLAALRECLPFLVQTSPPTDCGGLVKTISDIREVPAGCVVVGAGSSALIFLALLHWCHPASRVLLLDPTYGEYAHVLERVIGCRVERFHVHRHNGYEPDLEELRRQIQRGYDLVVLVNPNSPTGRHVRRDDLQPVLQSAPRRTRIWIDETYMEYAGDGESLERFAGDQDHVVVCKSLSKVYALSGLRVAYLVGPAGLMADLRGRTPPWAVSLPAQLAAVRALQDPEYYRARYQETHSLRDRLVHGLRGGCPDLDVLPGIANFVLAHLSPAAPDAATVVQRCREEGVFLRDAGGMSPRLGNRTLRIAVRDADANDRIAAALQKALRR